MACASAKATVLNTEKAILGTSVHVIGIDTVKDHLYTNRQVATWVILSGGHLHLPAAGSTWLKQNGAAYYRGEQHAATGTTS